MNTIYNRIRKEMLEPIKTDFFHVTFSPVSCNPVKNPETSNNKKMTATIRSYAWLTQWFLTTFTNVKVLKYEYQSYNGKKSQTYYFKAVDAANFIKAVRVEQRELVKESDQETQRFTPDIFNRFLSHWEVTSKKAEEAAIGILTTKSSIKLVNHSIPSEEKRHKKLSSLVEETLSKIMIAIPQMTMNYTTITAMEDQVRAHEEAKKFLVDNLSLIGAEISFIHPPGNLPTLEMSVLQIFIDSEPLYSISAPLSPSVFSWKNTQGVQEDIQRDGQKDDHSRIIYGVASQYNGCEAPFRYTVCPGKAIETYRNDHTQGPQAQLQFPGEQVELINCAGNLGFNGLSHVLEENTKDAIEHGYLTPTSQNTHLVIQQLLLRGHRLEYACIANIPKGGRKSIHQILVSAPAFGQYRKYPAADQEEENKVQFLCALHGFRAQFKEVLRLSDTGDRVIFKPTAVGLGVFENDPKIIALAFYEAAKEVEPQLVENSVKVQVQVFKGTGKAREMVNCLFLQEDVS